MSLAAAIGYAIGIMVFALFFRYRKRKMTDKYIQKAETKLSKLKKGNPND